LVDKDRYLQRCPSLGDVSALRVGLADPSPEHAAALGGVIEGLGRVKLAPVIPEPDADVLLGVERRPLVGGRIVPPERVVVMAVVVHAGLHNVHDVPNNGAVLAEGVGHVDAVPGRLAAGGDGVEVDALPHPRPRDAVEEAGEELEADEVLGPVDDGDAGVVALGVVLGPDDDAPGVVRRVEPRRGGVTEVLGPDPRRRVQDRVALVLGPVGEQRVGVVGGDGEALHLHGGVGGAGVEHGEAAVGERGGGACPDAVGVVPLVRHHG